MTSLNRNGLKHYRSGHPWLTVDHLSEGFHLPKVPGVFAFEDKWYFLSPKSYLRLRRFGPPAWKVVRSEPIVDEQTFAKIFSQDLTAFFRDLWFDKKCRVENDELFRWVFADNDFCPGLVVDVFGDTVVCQILSAPLEVFWAVFKKSLNHAYQQITGRAVACWIEQRSDPIRKKEGLAVIPATQDSDDANQPQIVQWNGLKWQIRPGRSQKTGSYLDQRRNHRRTVEWAKAFGYRTALDVCCFEGGFSLHLLKEGLSVTTVDRSKAALDALAINAQLNKISADGYRLVEADAFSFLKDYQKHSKVDLIVLDPPPLTRPGTAKDPALRAFHDLNLRAVLALNKNGLLVSCSCSHAIGSNEMTQIFSEISATTHRALRPIEVLGPSPDHAPLVNFPEGQYLTCFILRGD